VIPRAFYQKHGALMASELAKLLNSGKFRKYVGDDARYQNIIAAFDGLATNAGTLQ